MRSRVPSGLARPGLLVAVAALAVGASACSKVARVFLDLPAPVRTERAEPDQALIDSLFSMVEARIEPEPPRPAIEAVSDLDSTRALLPEHPAGGVDWSVAVEARVVDPRIEVEGGEPSGEDPDLDFGYDLLLGNREASAAAFPHSQHAYWLGCSGCHPTPYRGSGRDSELKETHGQTSCGLCHGPVAFTVQSCERCHAGASLPSRPAEDNFFSELRMYRPGDEGDNEIFGVALNPDDYPPAVFSHGIHRVRYRCVTCHAQAFPIGGVRRGMDQATAHSSKGCGMCHNGVAAFETGLGDCERCHRAPGA